MLKLEKLEMNKSKRFCKYGHDTFKIGRTENNRCKACKYKYVKNWMTNNDTYQKKNRFRSQISNWKEQGIYLTKDQYSQLLVIQKNLCKICKRHQTELKKALAVDHDHKTGIIRGLLCDTCNRFVGRIEKYPEITLRILQYLKIVDNQ